MRKVSRDSQHLRKHRTAFDFNRRLFDVHRAWSDDVDSFGNFGWHSVRELEETEGRGTSLQSTEMGRDCCARFVSVWTRSRMLVASYFKRRTTRPVECPNVVYGDNFYS